jgi:uncharacterized protein YyaL (SSP411 family)
MFARVCGETARWVMREMQSPEGGYYSSLDADSEHEEGKFYVWSREEFAELLDEAERAIAEAVYGLDRAPNFEGAYWHLRIEQPLEAAAERLGIDAGEARRHLEAARSKLFEARERRMHPGRDDKILTSWNALMIQAMAHAGRVLGEPEYIRSARRAFEFVRARLWRDGRLLATFKDGRAHLNAYLDDYAFLLAALLELIEVELHTDDLRMARTLADALLEQFEDRTDGGFFFTSHDHEPLILRTKPGHDNATPSGNGVAAFALQRLGHLIGESRYLDAAERTLRLFLPQMREHASAFATLCGALSEHVEPPALVVLTGPRGETAAWLAALAQHYHPGTSAIALPERVHGLPVALDKPGTTERVNAWVCRGVNCLPPIDRMDVLQATLAIVPKPAESS